jgi:hypothetical protein
MADVSKNIQMAQSPPNGDGESVTAALAEAAKNVIARQGASSVKRQMIKFYKVMRLMDDQDEWVTAEIAAIGEQLSGENLTLNSINDFIDDIKRVNDQNSYLMDFVGALKNRPLGDVIQSMKLSEAAVIPEIVGFAMVLQNLTSAFRSDIDRVDVMMSHWEQERKKLDLRDWQRLAFRLKFESIRTPIRKAHECVRSGKVPDDFCNFLLPFNILQAAAYDLFKGHSANAGAGYTLSRHQPGNATDPGTGAGPVHFAAGGEVIESGLPLPGKWVDLYQSWNLAFGSQFHTFPLYICKLIIPQVAGYHKAPQQYVWDRTYALMAYLYFAGFAAYDHKQGRAVDSAYYRNDWSAFEEAGLYKLWGDVNYLSAADYAGNVKAARAR